MRALPTHSNAATPALATQGRALPRPFTRARRTPSPASWPLQAGIALAASVLAALALARTGSPIVLAGAIGAIALVAAGFLRPAAFLVLFLLMRPVLDEFSHLDVGVSGANVAGGTAMILIPMALALVLQRRSAVTTTATTAAYLGIAVVTAGTAVVASADFGATVGGDPASEAIRVFCLAAMLVLATNILTTADRVRATVVAIGLSGAVPAVWAIIEIPAVMAEAGADDLARVSGPFTGPNPLGQYLAATALVLLAVPRAWLDNRIRLAALLPQLIAIVPTYSRVGWVMLVLGVAMLYWRRHRHVIIGMVVVVSAVVMLVPTVKQRVLPSETPTPGAAPTYESQSWRVDNWVTLLDRWTERPFIGYGAGTTIYVNPRRTANHINAPDGGYEAHNTVVRILVEGGLALLAVYIALGLAVAASMRRLVRRAWEFRTVARLVALLWLLILVAGVLTDDLFGNTALMFAVVALTGALEGAHRLLERLRNEDGRGADLVSTMPTRPRTS